MRIRETISNSLSLVPRKYRRRQILPALQTEMLVTEFVTHRAAPSMNSSMQVEDSADLFYRLGRGLSRVPRAHDQLGFNAVDMRALVLDDPVVGVLDRPCSLHRN